MNLPVDDYIATCLPEQQAELKRIQAVVMRSIPAVEQGISYAMPAYMYKGKALLSCMVNKNFFSIYPFSGKVIDRLQEELQEYEVSAGSGSVHFTLERPLPESLLSQIIMARKKEIEDQAAIRPTKPS
ncbi:DUF1801 domain-containing protein [Patescibacteria group bacterium]|nr:DUF1801 domain-containing protein [Patescibacteria group bacterium]